MINELIEKYEDKAKECEEALDMAKEKKSTEWEKHYIYISYIYKNILSDLEQLKESIKDLDITSINAPNSVVVAIIKKEIIGE